MIVETHFYKKVHSSLLSILQLWFPPGGPLPQLHHFHPWWPPLARRPQDRPGGVQPPGAPLPTAARPAGEGGVYGAGGFGAAGVSHLRRHGGGWRTFAAMWHLRWKGKSDRSGFFLEKRMGIGWNWKVICCPALICKWCCFCGTNDGLCGEVFLCEVVVAALPMCIVTRHRLGDGSKLYILKIHGFYSQNMPKWVMDLFFLGISMSFFWTKISMMFGHFWSKVCEKNLTSLVSDSHHLWGACAVEWIRRNHSPQCPICGQATWPSVSLPVWMWKCRQKPSAKKWKSVQASWIYGEISVLGRVLGFFLLKWLLN